MIRALRLVAVLAAGAGIAAAGSAGRIAPLDLSAAGWTAHLGGPAAGPPLGTSPRAGGDALPARTAAVQRAELVCPGPETIGVRGVAPTGTAPAPAGVDVARPPAAVNQDAASVDGTVAGAARLTARSLPGSPLDLRAARSAPADGTGGAAATSNTATSNTATSSTLPAAVRVLATGALAPGLAATQTTQVPDGDLRGLSSAACATPSDDAWLVAGGTEPGRRGRLVLANPAANPVDVDVDVLGEDGPVHRSAGSSVQVPPRSRTVVLLDALAPGVRSPVVHVTTTAGAVAATLSDAWLTGTTPQGLDDAAPGADPAREALVPALLGGGPSSVRVASTGPAEAVAQVRVLGPSGAVPLPGGGVLRVPARSTRSLDLGPLPPGGYLVDVVADAPVAAGALVRRTGAVGELAWFGSTRAGRALVGGAGLRGGAGWSSSLVLGAPRDRVRGDLVLLRADGSSRTEPVDVAAGTVQIVGTADAVAAWVRPRADTGVLVAARATTREDPRGQLLTGGALVPTPVTQQLPAVVPER